LVNSLPADIVETGVTANKSDSTTINLLETSR